MQTTSEGYRVVYEGGEGEITEKKSRFIATVRPVESEEGCQTQLFCVCHWRASGIDEVFG